MKGYISINVDGKPVGLKFAYPANRMFAEALEKKPELYIISGEKADFTIEGLAKFIHCGYLNNCLIKEVEPSLTYEDFFNYAEEALELEARVEEIGKIMQCWSETYYARKITEAAEKKSLIGIS